MIQIAKIAPKFRLLLNTSKSTNLYLFSTGLALFGLACLALLLLFQNDPSSLNLLVLAITFLVGVVHLFIIKDTFTKTNSHLRSLDREIEDMRSNQADARRAFGVRLNEEIEKKTENITRMMRELHLSNVSLRSENSVDRLTGIPNRPHAERFLDQVRLGEGKKFGFALIDADHFKAINDTYGHDVGDECLKQLARCLTNSLSRQEVTVARWGGEEFVALFSGLESKDVYEGLNNFRQEVADQQILNGDDRISMTVSIGFAWASNSSEVDLKFLSKRADEALYEAKHMGRNQVVKSDWYNLNGINAEAS